MKGAIFQTKEKVSDETKSLLSRFGIIIEDNPNGEKKQSIKGKLIL